MKAIAVPQSEILLNSFASRALRDVADADYISARLAYRSSLFLQFYWAGLQACEKYIKAILLYNRIPSHSMNHSLSAGLKLGKKLPFDILLSDTSRSVMEQLDEFGTNRYLEWSYSVHGPKLNQLDKAVWELRRYCKVLNWRMQMDDGSERNMLRQGVAAIVAAEKSPPQKYRLHGGFIEKVIHDSRHPAREPLLWKNMCFGLRVRKQVRIRVPTHFTNAPLTLNPEMLDELVKYVKVTDGAKSVYRNIARERTAGATNS